MRTTTVLLLAALAAAACGPSRPTASAAPPPAKILSGEADLATIHLTEEAELRLGITTAAVARRAVERVHWLPGRTVLAPGAATTVQAPLAGRLVLPEGGQLAAGTAVTAGTPVVLLAPLVGPDTRANLAMAGESIRGRLERAVAEEEAARLARTRAERLLADRVGSARAVEEEATALRVAEAARAGAERELGTMAGVLGALDRAGDAAIPIATDRDATLTAVHAFGGQFVPAGAPLFDLEDRGRLWLRVDVPLAMHDRLAVAGPVRFGPPAQRDLDVATVATPVAALSVADPATASRVLYYEFDNAGGAHPPGERCAVAMSEIRPAAAVGDGDDRHVLPAAAIVHDAYGGAWVYERHAPHEYRRRRVGVEFTTGGMAVLTAGPAVGTEVVITGTAELFGVEFGVGK